MSSNQTIDVKYINPFVAATFDVMNTMANKKIVRKEVSLKKNLKLVGDISGVIGVTGGTMEGTVAITFPEKLARDIVAAMAGMSPNDLTTADLHDGVGEIVNMIAGNAKTSLSSQEGLRLSLSLPTIVCGQGHEIGLQQGTPYFVILFETEGINFGIEVAITFGKSQKNR